MYDWLEGLTCKDRQEVLCAEQKDQYKIEIDSALAMICQLCTYNPCLSRLSPPQLMPFAETPSGRDVVQYQSSTWGTVQMHTRTIERALQ